MAFEQAASLSAAEGGETAAEQWRLTGEESVSVTEAWGMLQVGDAAVSYSCFAGASPLVFSLYTDLGFGFGV